MRQLTILLLLCCIVFACGGSDTGQWNLNKSIGWGKSDSTLLYKTLTDSYRNDLIILKTNLDSIYPSLYRFNDRLSIEKLFTQGFGSISNKTTAKDFYRGIKYIISQINDGHLSCNPSDSLRKELTEEEKYFPISLLFTDDKAYVNCSNLRTMVTGNQITKINGEEVNKIKNKLFQYIASDGKVESRKYWVLNRYFWFYYNLVYGSFHQFSVTYKNTDGQSTTITIPANYQKNNECQNLLENNESKPLSFRYLNSRTAIMTIRTFAHDELLDANLNFELFLDSCFRNLKESSATSLIIDLRGNGGGRDAYGSLLYSYLTNKSFKYYERLETSTKVLTENEHPNLSIQNPNPMNFTGKVYILINGLSFSATSEFCTIARNNKRAIFIGEETGGTYCGNTSGSFKELLLPYSKIIVSIPTVKYTMYVTDKQNRDRGIMPDYSIKPTIEDLIRKKDIQLNLAIKMTENK